MPVFFTPLADGDVGRADAINSRFTEMEAAIQGNPGALIALTPWTTLVDNQASITIDVAAGYNVLHLQASLRTNRAGSAIDSVLLTLNDDISSTYTVKAGYFDGSGSGYNLADTSGSNGFDIAAAATAATALSGQYSFFRVQIPEASSAAAKHCAIDSICDGATYPAFIFGAGNYPNPVTITRIKLVPKNGTVFLAGSRTALFGMG